MKKSLLVLLLTSGVLFAQQGVFSAQHKVRHLERMKNMHEMEIAMSEIQKGFLFDNLNVVKNGVKHLKKSIGHTESFIKNECNDKGFNSLVYAKRQATDIAELADEVLFTFEKGNRYGAAGSYLKILSKCLSCHQTVRSW